MADLPTSRLSSFNPPFTHTGIDYFGPIIIKQGRRTRSKPGTNKCYVSLFTCLTYRAVHLEVVSDMTTDCFIMAVQRFISRRGRPLHIYSDNGQNFVGANNEIIKLLKYLDKSMITQQFSMFNVTWHFIPPAGPWMGGAWESLVKVTKKAMKTITKTRPVYEEQLRTILIEVEATVNSRPLTSVSSDHNDINALTPNHFLIGRSMSVQGTTTENELKSRKRWKVVEAMSNIYWKRFLHEYLSSLNYRSKWNKPTRNFKLCDIILLKTEYTPRAHWPLAKVIEVYPGKDGYIRSVKIELADTTLVRPVNKLCLLEERYVFR